jgi:hypothetical protein
MSTTLVHDHPTRPFAVAGLVVLRRRDGIL